MYKISWIECIVRPKSKQTSYWIRKFWYCEGETIYVVTFYPQQKVREENGLLSL